MPDPSIAAVPRRGHARVAARMLAVLAGPAVPALAFAHTGADAGAHHGFGAGFAHPFTGLDHLAAMLAVGLWSAVAAAQAQWRDYVRMPAAFVALLLTGALLGAAGGQLPLVEPTIAASLLVLGLLVARRQVLPSIAGALLVAVFALFHGAAHGQELAGTAALAGMVLATALLHAAGLGLGHLVRTRSRWWPRVAGGATMLLGAALLTS